MKRLKTSILIKTTLFLLSFSCGFFAAYEAYHILIYLNNYSIEDESVEQTNEFGALYLKYLERVCVYVKHREAGYQNDPSSIYSSSDLVSVLTGAAEGNLKPSNSVYDFTQDSFEYYNRLLNIDCRNFFYYVKNIDTKESYFSPHFQELLASSSNMTNEEIEEYLKNISKKPSYLILSTNNGLYSSNLNSSSFYTPDASQILWCINFLNPNVLIDQPINNTTRIIEEGSIIDFKETQVANDQYMVYTFYDSNFSNQDGEFSSLMYEFNRYKTAYDRAKYTTPIALILCFLFTVLFLNCVGHKKNVNGIYLNAYDRWYAELALLPLPLLLLPSSYLLDLYFSYNRSTFYIGYFGLFLNIYFVLALAITTIVKRLKAHTFLSSFLMVGLASKAHYIAKGWSTAMSMNYHAGLHFVFIIVSFISAQILSFVFFWNYRYLYLCSCLFLLLLLGITMMKFYIDLNIVIKGTREIINGDLNSRIPNETMTEPVKQLAQDINNIRGGLSNALEEQIKSERLKTELITNVSHDIKTPLTSIINYVDLLKKQDLQDEKSITYLQILTDKSWRLKTLIEDLVEASKASSGAITLHPQKLSLTELVKQALGEYEDRLLECCLEPIFTACNEKLFIWADGRSTYRIIENLLSNVCKYAMKSTRVYIELTIQHSNAVLEMKNISTVQLGMHSDDLIERFVRGDSSRHTEGSGLGLSIANSLTTLQHGTFELFVDGDLFKAIVSLPLYQGDD